MLDGDGRVVCRNDEATRLIESLGLAEAKLTCCSLLGCRVPETVLEAACVTELALGRDAPLPEIRVDIRLRLQRGPPPRPRTGVAIGLPPCAWRRCSRSTRTSTGG